MSAIRWKKSKGRRDEQINIECLETQMAIAESYVCFANQFFISQLEAFCRSFALLNERTTHVKNVLREVSQCAKNFFRDPFVCFLCDFDRFKLDSRGTSWFLFISEGIPEIEINRYLMQYQQKLMDKYEFVYTFQRTHIKKMSDIFILIRKTF